ALESSDYWAAAKAVGGVGRLSLRVTGVAGCAWLGSADAAKADEDAGRGRRRHVTDRERAGKRTEEERAAAHQRTGKVRCRARPSEAHLVIAEAAPARTVGRVWHPIRHPLG